MDSESSDPGEEAAGVWNNYPVTSLEVKNMSSFYSTLQYVLMML
jgi:hypothetical protein